MALVWVSTSVDNLNKVFRLQKRAARIILNADTRANSVDLFRELSPSQGGGGGVHVPKIP